MIFEDVMDLVLRIIINSIDIAILYFLCHNLMNKKPKVKIVHALLAMLYGLMVGIIGFYLDCLQKIALA